MNILIPCLISVGFWSLPYLTGLLAPTVFVALVPVLFLVYSRHVYTLKYFLFIAVIVSSISLFGVARYSFGAYLVSIVITSLFAVVFLLISQKLVRIPSLNKFSIFIPPTVWTTFCLTLNFRALFTGAFDMGIVLPYTAPVIWYIGSIGITYIIILSSSALARFLALKDKIALFVGTLLIVILCLNIYYSQTKDVKDLVEKDASPIKLSLVQNNISESWQYLQQNPYKVLKANQELTKKASKENPDIIVWPEYALPVDIVNSHSAVRDAVTEIAQEANAKLVLGSILFDKDTGWHDDISLLARENGNIINVHSSINPAPFDRFTKRQKETLLNPIDGFGAIICWEELNPDVARKYVKNGANFLLTLANNQDLDNTPLKFYASSYSRARASENMRYFARVTNTGVTQVIDPLGRVVKFLKPNTQGVLTADVFPIKGKTFYTQHGPLLVILTNILIGFCIFITILRDKNIVFAKKR